MSAKPQPMAGQSDATDDLISELARLMQQEVDGGAPKPVPPPTFSVRIPGDDDKPAPLRSDFSQSAVSSAKPAAATPLPSAAVDDAPEPFKFDFDVALPKRGETQFAPIPTKPRVPATPASVSAPDVAQPQPADMHDSIADLIAAELLADAPAPVSNQSSPALHAGNPSASQPAAEAEAGAAPFEPHDHGFEVEPPAAAERKEHDRFSFAPVFGLGSPPPRVEPDLGPIVSEPVPDAPVLASLAPTDPRPAQPVPQGPIVPAQAADDIDDNLGRDPIDEIENLIGRAMRVEFDGNPAPVERPAASPALRSLATPTAPVAPSKPPRSEIASPDDAILAAADATGVQVGWVDGPEADEVEPAVVRERKQRSFRLSRSVAGPLVAITLLIAAGFGLYMVLGLGQDSGPAPLLTADASPVKETPSAPPESNVQQSVVFNEIDGVVPGAEEQLVSRDQTDINEVTQTPPSAEVSEEGLANRRVRTVTVRPDGTIVSGEDSVAGSSILPVARPVVPEVPGAESPSPELLASVQPVAEPTPTLTPAPEPAVTVVPVTPGAIVPAVDAAGNPLAGRTAPVPMLRPAGLVQQTAPTTPTPVSAVVNTPVSGGNSLPPAPATSMLQTPAAAAPAPSTTVPGAVEVPAIANTAPAYVQLASQRTEAEARTTAQAMVSRYGPLFGGANMEVQRVDLGTRGIYYRVRVPANSLQEANSICANVKAAGGDCFAQ